MRLFLTGLSIIPSTGHRTIYRGVKLNLRNRYKEGARIVWWAFSSCTKILGVLEKEQFIGKSGTRILFAIECDTRKNIHEHSFYPDEDERLLLPDGEFEVVSSVDMGNQRSMIQLKEVEPRFPNIAFVPSLTIKPVKIPYSCERLTDNEIPRIIKEALEQQQCTKLDLFGNRMTHEGAALLTKALKSNKLRKSFDLFLRIESRQILSIYMNELSIKHVDIQGKKEYSKESK